ncbi:hypothetical protein GUJ93_ZPchr0001g31898 [Zizania palustris]|uniref:Uncharacterized protein n=1 Tax=Zizania palustris TaxID=103762 RepID=A0A8J5RQJ0_ZIZPA|nr:hypothetical protein GUJ93_ZPchr0001g31898 [Zizania palustris]
MNEAEVSQVKDVNNCRKEGVSFKQKHHTEVNGDTLNNKSYKRDWSLAGGLIPNGVSLLEVLPIRLLTRSKQPVHRKCMPGSGRPHGLKKPLKRTLAWTLLCFVGT